MMLYVSYSSAKLGENDRMLQCPAAKNNKYSQQELHLIFPLSCGFSLTTVAGPGHSGACSFQKQTYIHVLGKGCSCILRDIIFLE